MAGHSGGRDSSLAIITAALLGAVLGALVVASLPPLWQARLRVRAAWATPERGAASRPSRRRSPIDAVVQEQQPAEAPWLVAVAPMSHLHPAWLTAGRSRASLVGAGLLDIAREGPAYKIANVSGPGLLALSARPPPCTQAGQQPPPRPPPLPPGAVNASALWGRRLRLDPRGIQRGLLSFGDPTRLRRVVAALQAGEGVVVGAIGASITTGAGGSLPEGPWPGYVTQVGGWPWGVGSGVWGGEGGRELVGGAEGRSLLQAGLSHPRGLQCLTPTRPLHLVPVTVSRSPCSPQPHAPRPAPHPCCSPPPSAV